MVSRFLLAGLGSLSLLAAASAAPPILDDPAAPENGAIRVVPRVPFGKTLVLPVSASDPDGDPLAFRVSSNNPKVFVAVRSGNPILRVHVEYAGAQAPAESAPFSGDLDFQLFRDLAPITSGHIGGLAQAGYYNDLIFHRIIPGFVAQAGDPAGNGSGLSDPNNPDSFIGLPYGFEHEFRPSLIFSGRGQLAMANSNGGYNRGNHAGSGLISLGDFSATNGSQFFITYAQPRHLDFKHTIFGQLIRGFDLLDKMATVPRDAGDKPVVPVRMTSVTLHPGVTDATLTVSAIDLGPSIVTLTATDPGGASASRSFVVNVEEDDFNDPPVLRPIPNLLAPVGQRPELPLRAFDLEQDYLLYGIATVSGNPQAGNFGFAQIASTFAPLSSPGFQDLGVGVAGFNDTRLDDEASAVSPFAPFEPYNFQVAELAYGDRPISVIGRALHADAGAAFADVIVAHFRDADVAGQLVDFSAIVNWGDGTAENSSTETAPRVKIERSATEPGGFVVKASHTYARPGIYPLRLTIDAPLGATGIATTQAIVAQTATGARVEGRDLGSSTSRIDNRVIATFNAESGTARDWSAQIDWGDGGVSAGMIRRRSENSFAIRGSHQYRNSGAQAIRIHLHGPTLDPAGAIAWSAVDIAGGELPRSLPPFAMPHLVGQIGGVPVDPSNAGGAQKEFKATVGSGANSQTFFTASIVIVNAGNEKSREGSLRFYLSTDGTLNLSPVTNPDNSTTPADIPLKIGSFPKGRTPPLKPGDGLRYNFDAVNGEDLRLAAPRGETGAGLFLLASFDYTDDVADHMPIDREVQFGPINGIIVTPLRLQLTEAAGTTQSGSFTVRLDRAPVADVRIPISVADTNELTSDKTELVFTADNWNTPQAVTVTAADDAATESFESVQVRLDPSVSTDPRWDKMDGADVTVSIQDND